MRVHEQELGDDAFDTLLARAVVYGGDRMVRRGTEACERECRAYGRARADARRLKIGAPFVAHHELSYSTPPTKDEAP
jgi:hypothetical protein